MPVIEKIAFFLQLLHNFVLHFRYLAETFHIPVRKFGIRVLY